MQTCGPPALVACSAQAHDRLHRGFLHHGSERMLQEEAKRRVCERYSKCSGTSVAQACHDRCPCSQRPAQVSTMAADNTLQRCGCRVTFNTSEGITVFKQYVQHARSMKATALCTARSPIIPQTIPSGFRTKHASAPCHCPMSSATSSWFHVTFGLVKLIQV